MRLGLIFSNHLVIRDDRAAGRKLVSKGVRAGISKAERNQHLLALRDAVSQHITSRHTPELVGCHYDSAGELLWTGNLSDSEGLKEAEAAYSKTA